MTNTNKPETVDQYIQAAPAASIAIMEELKQLIETAVPQAKGGISWNVPIYKHFGILAGFDVAKKHVSFGIDCLQEADRKALNQLGYKTGKSTIQIKFDQAVPKAELVQLIKTQAKLNEA